MLGLGPSVYNLKQSDHDDDDALIVTKTLTVTSIPESLLSPLPHSRAASSIPPSTPPP